MSKIHLEIIDRDPYIKTRRRESRILKGKKQKEERYFVCPRCGKIAPYPKDVDLAHECPHCGLWYMWKGRDYLIISDSMFAAWQVTYNNLGTQGKIML